MPFVERTNIETCIGAQIPLLNKIINALRMIVGKDLGTLFNCYLFPEVEK